MGERTSLDGVSADWNLWSFYTVWRLSQDCRVCRPSMGSIYSSENGEVNE